MSRIFRIAIPALPLLASSLLAGINVSPIRAQTVETGKREILLQADSSWNGKPYTQYPAGRPQLTMLKVTMKPNTALPWHTHPIPNAGYVLSGDLTLHDRASGATHTYRTGESFAESVDDEHRGEAGANGAVLLLPMPGYPGPPRPFLQRARSRNTDPRITYSWGEGQRPIASAGSSASSNVEFRGAGHRARISRDPSARNDKSTLSPATN
jgi:quercetin dioxygenase-like cupin family protein